MEIHELNKLHLIFLGSVLYLQYGGNATAFPPTCCWLPGRFLEAEAIACHSLMHHNESLLQWYL